MTLTPVPPLYAHGTTGTVYVDAEGMRRAWVMETARTEPGYRYQWEAYTRRGAMLAHGCSPTEAAAVEAATSVCRAAAMGGR